MSDTESQVHQHGMWRGFGPWNFYFIAKIALYWAGSINFDVFYNLVFAAFLLIPLKPMQLHIMRSLIALPVAIALLYYDSWFPPISRLFEQSEILKFSNQYILNSYNKCNA